MSEQGLPAAADGQLVEFLLMLVGDRSAKFGGQTLRYQAA